MVVGKTNTSRRVYLVPELMRTTGLTEQERANGKLMVDIAQTTKKEPKDRNELILNCARDLRTDFNGEGFGLQPLRNLEGFVLNPPQFKTAKWEQVDAKQCLNLTKLLRPCVLQR
jgi:hypothetical protein